MRSRESDAWRLDARRRRRRRRRRHRRRCRYRRERCRGAIKSAPRRVPFDAAKVLHKAKKGRYISRAASLIRTLLREKLYKILSRENNRLGITYYKRVSARISNVYIALNILSRQSGEEKKHKN